MSVERIRLPDESEFTQQRRTGQERAGDGSSTPSAASSDTKQASQRLAAPLFLH